MALRPKRIGEGERKAVNASETVYSRWLSRNLLFL